MGAHTTCGESYDRVSHCYRVRFDGGFRVGITESEIKKNVTDYLHKNGWLILRINQGAMRIGQRVVPFAQWWGGKFKGLGSGVHDLIAFHPDYPPLSVECKRPGKTPTEGQVLFAQQWLKHGGMTIVIDSLDLTPLINLLGE